ncbi:MAG TPA: glycosyltransferase, partial [Synergistaceae bacterium]|nr:glycosyltransferase [Synergistaceae bacterium]
GGVERHVLWLSNELAAMGHTVVVVSAGGKLEPQLRDATHLRLPVHKKNLLTGLSCALRLARYARTNRVDVLHAHSRVPAWIAWWTARLSGVPFVLTAHDPYRLSAALAPYRRASAVICVSGAVRSHLVSIFRGESPVILNGLHPLTHRWMPSDARGRFLFVGRITERKGLQIAISALADVSLPWTLDVVGDGPLRANLEEMARSGGLGDRVTFHGFRDDPDEWMKRCSCFLFPSLSEGMGLTLMRAVQMGVPVLASDLPPVRELTAAPETLLPPGDVPAWRAAIEGFLSGGDPSSFERDRIPTIGDMACAVAQVYRRVTGTP